MDIRYSYRIEDFEEVAEVADKLVPRRRAIRFGLVWVGVLLLIAPFLAGPGLLHPDPFLLGMSVFAVVMISCGVLQTPRRVARKYYAAAIDGTDYEASINEDAITTKSPTGYSVLQWTAFSKVIAGQNAIGLVDKTIMYVFPRRAFTPEEWDKFLSLLRQHVPVWDGPERSVRLHSSQ
jgi:hypothetical protein